MVPVLSRFYGVIIKMFHEDHAPPHFHAIYGEHEASINIKNLSLMTGKLPPRALGLVIEWASLHQKELMSCWKKAENLEPLGEIDPLK